MSKTCFRLLSDGNLCFTKIISFKVQKVIHHVYESITYTMVVFMDGFIA